MRCENVKRGDICYILESNYRITQVKIINRQGKFYTVQPIGSCGAIRLKEHRLFATDEEAENSKFVGKKEPKDSENGFPKIPDVFAGRRTNHNPHNTR